MADVWSIKGITPKEREDITQMAKAIDVPIGRFIVRACVAFAQGDNAAMPERERQQHWDHFERMMRLAHETTGSKDRASQAGRRILRAAIEAQATIITPGQGQPTKPPQIGGKRPAPQLNGKRPAPMIEGNTEEAKP